MEERRWEKHEESEQESEGGEKILKLSTVLCCKLIFYSSSIHFQHPNNQIYENKPTFSQCSTIRFYYANGL